jgi:hypothetical protein
MAYLDPKGEGDHSMPGKQRSCSQVYEARRCGTRVIWRTAGLLDIPISRRCKIPSVGKTPETGVTSCGDIGGRS